jgi:broad specificity phosphatase PhoE
LTVGEVVLVRHGETEGKSSIRLNGSTDVALNETGRGQMRAVGEALAAEVFDRVIVSPLLRSREGAEIVLGGRGPRAQIVEGFREIDFGDWEGLTFAEVEQRDPAGYARYRTEGLGFRFPNGDSRAGFRARVAAAVPGAIPDPRARTLGVLHKGVIKIILAELLGLAFEEYSDIPVGLGSVHRVRHDGTRWQRVD